MALTDQQKEQILNRLKVYLPDEDSEALLVQLISDAADFVESYTYRTEIPDPLMRPVGDLAIIAYNRRGTEGESGRSEGGESYSFEGAPPEVYEILKRYRLAKIGGQVYETAEADKS